MSDKEDKGFTVVDRRRVNAGDGGAEPAREDEAAAGESGSAEHHEIDFGTFVMSLASSVLFHLGELVPEGEEQVTANLPLAKQTIDILGMLSEKTRGNLTDHEAKLVEHLLFDLRLKYVDARKKQ